MSDSQFLDAMKNQFSDMGKRGLVISGSRHAALFNKTYNKPPFRQLHPNNPVFHHRAFPD